MKELSFSKILLFYTYFLFIYSIAYHAIFKNQIYKNISIICISTVNWYDYLSNYLDSNLKKKWRKFFDKAFNRFEFSKRQRNFFFPFKSMQHTYVREFHISNLSIKHNSLPNAPYRTVPYKKKPKKSIFAVYSCLTDIPNIINKFTVRFVRLIKIV